MMYYEVLGSEGHIKKAIVSLKDCKPIVFKSKTSMYIPVPESELHFVQKVATDLGLQINPIGSELPPNRKMPCGKYYIESPNLGMHIGHCRVCRASQGKPEIKPAITVAKVKGLTQPTINSLVSAMKTRYEEIMNLADNLDKAIKALEGIEDFEKKVKFLAQEKEEHVKAIKYFCKDAE